MHNVKTYDSIQAFRGLAALAVMFFHFRWLINNEFPNTGDYLFGWGAIGVDLFFIISGFVITLSAQKLDTGVSASLTFIKSRLKRIMPTYFIILLVVFILSGGMSIFHYSEKLANLVSALTFRPIYTSNAPFYINDSGVYGVRWTLNYEIYFYLVSSLCLLTKRPLLCLLSFFITALVIIPVICGQQFTLSSEGYQFNNPYLNLLTNPISWMFISGVLIAKLVPLAQRLPATLRVTYLVCVTLYTVYSLFFLKQIGHGLLSSGFALILLMSGVVMNDAWLRRFTPRWLIFIGNISYSLYLIHTLMNTGLGKRLAWTGLSDGVTGFIIYSVISLILATLSYRYIETLFFSRSKKVNQNRKTDGLIADK